MTILDNSKLIMQDYWYNHLIPTYGHEKLKLLYTDTDSFIIEFKTDDIFKDFKNNKEQYDFSEYPKDHECYDASNKKKIGKFKDEVNG